ncbi:CinA family protein [Gayadomonas joobiniege]|uniref:CinA family protein n=1 Tax=Gayadomonas joobiniege TaxID=1234606 RepID=UPI0003755697|nr:CinA family protein [Gayadomonas joobiniege]
MLSQSILNGSTQCGAILTQYGLSIATAESCTGGGIAYALTEIAGSSAYFKQSVVTYSNQAKQDRLQVNAATLQKYGAVSEQTVSEMAMGLYQLSHCDLALVTSGIAGPGGATADKPVGLVHFAWLWQGEQLSLSAEVFSGNRSQVRSNAIEYALNRAHHLLKNYTANKT